MKRKIFIKLIGGLGNQLFQYACAKNLALELNGTLHIDDKTGFIFDNIFKRKKALPKNLDYNKIKPLDLICFYFLFILKKIFFKKKTFFNIGNHIIVDETVENKFIKNFFEKTKNYKKIYLIGFFQSEKYFFQNKKTITKKILKNKINNLNIEKIKKKIKRNSVFVGIRMFEEAPNNLRKNFGGLENFNFYNKYIKYFKKKNSQSNFFIFSTMKDKKKILEKINENILIVNEKYGKNDDLKYLLLFSCFRNFIISNSSFYWWGAYLAETKKDIKIVASKKFTNINTLPKNWKNTN